eukprot:4986723-Pleurochrysis_carterae.AAC.1
MMRPTLVCVPSRLLGAKLASSRRRGGACGTCEARSSCPSTSRWDPLRPSTCPTAPPPCLTGPMRA